MALKPKLRPASRAIDISGGGGRAFQRHPQGFELGAIDPRCARTSTIGLVDPAQYLDGMIEVEDDRILDAREFVMHHLGKAAFVEEVADAFEIVGHVGEA